MTIFISCVCIVVLLYCAAVLSGHPAREFFAASRNGWGVNILHYQIKSKREIIATVKTDRGLDQLESVVINAGNTLASSELKPGIFRIVIIIN